MYSSWASFAAASPAACWRRRVEERVGGAGLFVGLRAGLFERGRAGIARAHVSFTCYVVQL